MKPRTNDEDRNREDEATDSERAFKIATGIIARHLVDDERNKWHDVDVTLARALLRERRLRGPTLDERVTEIEKRLDDLEARIEKRGIHMEAW